MKLNRKSISIFSGFIISFSFNLKAQNLPERAPVFGTNGQTNFAMSAIIQGASGGEAVILDDGKVVIGGIGYTAWPWPRTVFIKFDPTCGKIDSTFGTNGIKHDDYEAIATVNSIALQSDGKIVAAGDVNSSFDTNGFPCVFRINPDGSRDSSFNNSGYKRDTFRGGVGRIGKVFTTHDDKIIAIVKGGSLFNMGCGAIKYKNNGERDSTFGINGFADIVYPYAPSQSGIGACMLADSSLMIATLVGTGPFGTRHLSLAKLTKQGLTDSSFAGTGYVDYLDIDFNLQSNFRVKLQELSNGRILLYYGINTSGQYIVRMQAFLPDGNIDSTFADNGMFSYGTTTKPGDFVVDSENRIIFFIGAHWNNGPAAMLRLQPNGTIDNSFGNNGVISYHHDPDGGGNDFRKFNGGFILPNGDILAYGESSVGFCASRFTFNPEIDGIPQINEANGELSTIGLGNFQWFWNGEPIDGANGRSFTPSENGSYTVSMGFEYCTFTSEPFEINDIGVGLHQFNDATIRIRNNPSHDLIFVDHAPANTLFEIYNIEGKKMQAMQTLHGNQVQIGHLAPGVYLLRLHASDQFRTFKIVRAPY